MVPEIELKKTQPATWETGVLVPLIQNIVGGAAAALLIALLAYAWNRLNSLPTNIEEVSIWAAVLGAVWATGWTVSRFFGDELGMFKAAYAAGQRSRDEEIARLNRQINSLQARAAGSEEKATDTATAQALLGKMKFDFENAKILLNVALGGGNIARDSSDHKVTDRPWSRASRLLVKAKVIEQHSNKLLVTSRQQASEQLSSYFVEQTHAAQGDVNFVPSWW